MMQLSELQRFCLKRMGITWFETRTLATIDFLVCVDEMMSEEKEALLARMMAALNWPSDRYLTLSVAGLSEAQSLQKLHDKTRASQPKKRIIFSEKLDLYKPVFEDESILTIGLSSLEKLLVDKTAKKTAWAKMQPLIES